MSVPPGSPVALPDAAPPTPGQPQLLRLINNRTALELLLERGPLSRVQICELTGLSKPTASRMLARLEDAGLVRPAGTSTGGPGRNAVLYAVNGRAAQVAAVDVEPRRITARISDLAGAVLAEQALAVRPGDDRTPSGLLRRVLEAATGQAGLTAAGLHSVSVAVPGAYDPAGDRLTLVAEGLSAWRGPDVLAHLRAGLAPTGLLVENDVNLAAVAERAHGVARGAASFAVLWVDDGLGLAIDLGGRLHRGATGGAGEVGYMPILTRPPSPTTVFGAGPGLPAASFQDLVGGPAVRVLARAHGLPGRDPARIVERALAAGDPASEAFSDEFAARLAAGLAVITSILDPDLVVLSGAIGRAGGAALARRVQRALRRVSKLRPTLLASGVQQPALTGATELALHHTRDVLFRAHVQEER